MDQNTALQIINHATQVSTDRQLHGLNPFLRANLAEHFTNLSRFINLQDYDVDTILRMLLYCDQQRQKGMQEYSRRRGRGETILPAMMDMVNNLRRIGNGTQIASDTDTLDMFAEYARYQYQLGTQGPNAEEDSFVPTPNELKNVGQIGSNEIRDRIESGRRAPEQIEGGVQMDAPKPASAKKKRKFGDNATDVQFEGRKRVITLSESQLNRVILESAKRLIRERYRR